MYYKITYTKHILEIRRKSVRISIPYTTKADKCFKFLLFIKYVYIFKKHEENRKNVSSPYGNKIVFKNKNVCEFLLNEIIEKLYKKF